MKFYAILTGINPGKEVFFAISVQRGGAAMKTAEAARVRIHIFVFMRIQPPFFPQRDE